MRQSTSNTRREHRRNVTYTIAHRNDSVYRGVCPRCHASLILRTGRYDTFIGCSNFPRCKFTADIR